jgi:hypothetical protein
MACSPGLQALAATFLRPTRRISPALLTQAWITDFFVLPAWDGETSAASVVAAGNATAAIANAAITDPTLLSLTMWCDTSDECASHPLMGRRAGCGRPVRRP